MSSQTDKKNNSKKSDVSVKEGKKKHYKEKLPNDKPTPLNLP